MTIPSTTRKAGPFTGNGSNTSFPFTFKVFSTEDVAVTVNNALGAETVLVLDSDYSVTLNVDQEATPGGTVTYPISGSPLASGLKLSITGAVAYEQGTDIPTGGDFNPTILENALDSLSMQIQQLDEAVSRAAVVPVTSPTDAAELSANIDLLATNITKLTTLYDNIDDIATVASDLNEPVSEINTVAGSIANVDAVGGSIANVNAVAGNATNINAVAGNATNINAVAGNATNINAVASNATNINAVAGVTASVTTVASNIVDIQNAEENAAAAVAAKVAAEAARDQTLAVYDSFDDRYLGSKTSDPTLDNDGNALVAGALYFNSVSGIMKLYTGSAWVAAYVQGVASSISFTPAGNVAATNVQAAIQEIDTEKIATTAIGSTVQGYDAATAKTNAVQTFTAAQRGAITTLTDGATITPDFAVTNNFQVTLGGNRTLANPTNLVAGQSGAIRIVQDGTGSRTLAYGSNWKFSNGAAPVLTTTANAVDLLVYFVESSSRITARLVGDVR